MRKTITRFVLLMALFVSSVAVFGQGVTTASMNGVVLDDKGASLPGANVVAVHVPSGSQYGVSTRDDGRFTLIGLRVGGPYKVTATFVGFENQVFDNIYMQLGQTFDLKISMKATGVNLGEVNVVGKGNQVFNSDRTGAATNVSREQLQNIPTISRSFTDMVRLTPQSSGNSFAGRNNLYNNLSIDGSVFNNSFGLSGTPGGQTNAQPISLDAIEEIQVSLAPYDVRQGGFTGAGINAVTRSGTNELSGSVYRFWRNENFVGKKVRDVEVTQSKFNQSQMGFRVGGPIIKNKVFFFINGEMERRDDPATTMVAKRDTIAKGDNISNVWASDLDKLKNFLVENYDYDPGVYEGFSLNTYNDKFLARVDFNLTNRHKFSIRYNYLKSWREALPSSSNSLGSSRYPSKNCLIFSNNTYKINNNIHSIIGELNSVFGNTASNNLIVGYTAFRDFRSTNGKEFPMVDILNNGTTMTAIGTEQYSPNNKLNTDVFQVSDNFTLYKGAHTLTVGGSFEYFKFQNGFTPQFYGYYRYNSLNDFIANAGTSTTAADSSKAPVNYQLQYSAMKGVAVPMAEIEAMQIGLYAQDEWNVRPNLKVTLGLRVDMPSYPIDLPKNSAIDTLKFMKPDGSAEKIDVSKLPDTKVMFSPRLGFNYDIFGDKSTQVRGGIGIFTGRIPFVWISNQASNNGVMFGNIYETKAANLKKYAFNADVRRYIPANPTLPATVTINATSNDFKFPQVFRTNLAVDQKLPGGIVGTFEFIYTKDLNAIFHRDANLLLPVGKMPDGRDSFPAVRKINAKVNNAYVLDNTSDGYSYFLTAQLQKSFDFGLNTMIAYTYGQTKDITSSPGSIASSSFTGNQIQSNPNNPTLSWSNYDMRHKVAASVSYRIEYMKHFASSISLVYVGMLGGNGSSNESLTDGRYSYTYSGDYNGDGISGNDLIYIPKDKSDINLVKASADDPRTAQQIWDELDYFINQDDYLKDHRGEIMNRNGAVVNWNSSLDLRFMQEVYMNVAGKRNTLQFSIDILNFGNFVDPYTDVKKTINNRNFLVYKGYNKTSKKHEFAFPYADAKNRQALSSTYRYNTGLASRWQIQFGVRYIFN